MSAFSSPSSTKETRLGEKVELQDLNKRLESYILKQRERDADALSQSRVLQELQDKAAKDLQDLQERADLALADARKKRDQQTATINALTTKLLRAEKELDIQARECQAEKAYRKAEEERHKEDSIRLELTQAELVRCKASLEKLEHTLAMSTDACESATQSAQLANAKADELTAQYSRAKSHLAALQDDFDQLRRESLVKIKALQDREEELLKLAGRTDEELRAEWESRLDELVRKTQDSAQQANDQALEMQRQAFAAKLDGLREQLEEQGQQLSQEKTKGGILQVEVRQLRTALSSSEIAKTTLEQQLVGLERLLEGERDRCAQTMGEQDQTIQRLKEEVARCETERDLSESERFLLTREIERYAALLDEEDAGAIRSSAKRQKQAPRQLSDTPRVDTRAASAAIAEEPPRSPTPLRAQTPPRSAALVGRSGVFASGVDGGGWYLRIANDAARTLNLSGFELQGPLGKAWPLPPLSIPRGGRWTLRLHARTEQGADGQSHVLPAEAYEVFQDVSVAVVDSRGNTVATVPLAPLQDAPVAVRC